MPRSGPDHRCGPRRHPASILGLVMLSTLAATPPGRVAAESPGPSEAITVEPHAIRLETASGRQQIAVTHHDPEGTVRDLTAAARYRLEPEGIAAISPSGVLTPLADGSTTLHIETSGCRARVPVQVVGFARTRPVSYRRDVSAILSKAGCNMGACHGNLNGKGGFRLSLRGDDPQFDLAMLTRDAFGRRVDPSRPDQSLVLLKPTGRLPHEGGLRLPPGSPEAAALRAWIAAGAPDDLDDAPRVTRLTVFPGERMLAAPDWSQQLVVTAEFSDGTRADVTRQAAYDPSDSVHVAVNTDGRVHATGPVESAVAVRYLDARAVSRLCFLPDRPRFVWSGPAATHPIDALVFERLRALRVNPSEPVPDHVFLRRAYLDTIGLLPTPDEVRSFLADHDPEKRAKWIDRLVERPEFADFWALKWADLLRNEEKTMGAKGVWVFQRWLRDQIAADVPLDVFVRRILTARGSTWQNPPASFYRTNRDPMTAAETVGQVFLGVRLQCARCHNHPFDVWTQDDYYGFAAFFGNVARKEVNNQRRDRLDLHEINGDEVVYLHGEPRVVQPRTGANLVPKPLAAPGPDLKGDPDAIDDLADWLTRDNPQFARNLANRVWFHLLGRGIVDPVDDFRDSNPPSNPALLDAITAELVARGMRLKPLVAWIMKSRTYQLGARPNETNAEDEAHFARCSVRLLPAEVLLDALGQALEEPESFGRAPRSARAVQLPGASPPGSGPGGSFVKTFGKPDRLLTCECERSEATTLAQAFQLINGPVVRGKLEADGNRIGRLLRSGASDDAILDELTLAALSRFPTPREREEAGSYLARAGDRRRAWEDLAWAIVNSKEFLLRH